MASYRLVGERQPVTPRKGRNRHASVSREYRHGSTVATLTPTDRTLGASNRQGWRLACTPEERAAHGAKLTRNTAAFVPSGERVPMRNIQPGKNGKRQLTERNAVQ